MYGTAATCAISSHEPATTVIPSTRRSRSDAVCAASRRRPGASTCPSATVPQRRDHERHGVAPLAVVSRRRRPGASSIGPNSRTSMPMR